MPAQLTPAQEDVLLEVAAAARDMIISVARTGSSAYDDAVYLFQCKWNLARREINAIFPNRHTVLVEDGRYGPKTGGALGIVTGVGGQWGFASLPPTRATGMTAWYAQNQSAVSNMVPPSQVVLPDALAHPGSASAPTQTLPQQVQQLPDPVLDALDNSSGSTVVTARTPTVSTTLPPEMAAPSNGDIVMDDGTVLTVPAGGGAPHEVVTPMTVYDAPEIPVLGTQRKGGLHWVALGLGGVGLGVGLWWLGRKKTTRRAA